MDNESKEIKTIEATQFYEPKEVTKLVNLTVPNLRKYADLIEKITDNTDYFVRNERNARLYKPEDIATLLRVNELKNDGLITLEKAIEQALGFSRNEEIATSEIASELRPNEQLKQAFEQQIQINLEMSNLIKEQSNQINEQSKMINEQSKQFNEQSNRIEQLLTAVESLSNIVNKQQESLEIDSSDNAVKDSEELSIKADSETVNNTKVDEPKEKRKGFFSRLFRK